MQFVDLQMLSSQNSLLIAEWEECKIVFTLNIYSDLMYPVTRLHINVRKTISLSSCYAAVNGKVLSR